MKVERDIGTMKGELVDAKKESEGEEREEEWGEDCTLLDSSGLCLLMLNSLS
jgi:hypothetical protein